MSEDENIESKSLEIDIGTLYTFDKKDLVLNINEENYSNLAYVQITQRDAKIDFLRMPGLKKDGKMVVSGIRVFMTHSAAQKMALAILSTLKKVDADGEIEEYDQKIEENYKPSRVVKRTMQSKKE
jgi:hypothetical protein